MIKMVKAKDLKLGMVVSTDGMVICLVAAVEGNWPNMEWIRVNGIAHGVFKSNSFRPYDKLPIYYDDSNGGED